ncbi:MAG: DUF2341 domain-containing protein [Candidatus Kariarchaeaceae archaeon]
MAQYLSMNNSFITSGDAAGRGGFVVTNLTLDIGQSITLWAAAYNYTLGYLGDYASTTWQESSGGSVITVTTPGASTTMLAQLIGGQSTITADYSGIQNTTSVTVNPPTIDFIIITNTPDGTALDTVVLDIGGNVTAYASGYNVTTGYVDLVEVVWTDVPDLGTFDNDTGTNMIFTAGFTGGSTNITGQNTTLLVSDNFTVVINDPTIDFIIITDSPDGNELEIVNIDIEGQVTAYASGYNNTGPTYVGLVEVDWTDLPDLGTFDNDTGTNTVFTAGQETGLTTITGQNTTLLVSDNFTVTIANLTVDYIIITDSPDGNELEIVNINIGRQVTVYASGYNNTGPTYVGLVEVDWTDLPNLGTFDNDTGTNAVFTAGYTGGSTNITGQNTTLIVSDNFTVVIADPTIDYIIITDSPGGNELGVVNIDIGGQVTAYASGYNNTGPTYVGLVEVDWTDDPDLGTFDNDTGTNTIFTAGFTGGFTNITGQNTTMVVSDNFTVNIAELTVDYIIITDAPDGNELEIVNIFIGGQVTAYASGYNNTGSTYVGLVEVDWTDVPDLGTFDNETGTNTVFTAGSTGGSTNITGQNTTLVVSDNFTVVITELTLDYIIITDSPDGNELEIVNIGIGEQVRAYASGYNNTGPTYIGLVEVDWTDLPDLGTFDNETGTNTIFTAGFTGGSTNITGQNTTLIISDNFTVVIADPTIDYVIITDSPNGNELEIVNIDIGGQVTAYASGYNTTSGYVDLVEVDWTDVPDLGTFDNDTGTNTVFTAGYTGGSTNITGQNTTLVVSDNFTVVIADPTIDYIIITDSPDGNELEVVNIGIGGQVTAFASGFNNTGPTYVGLVEVDWTDTPDLGTFDNDTGTNTVFTAGSIGGSTNITGQNTTLIVSDNFTVIIADPTVDYIIITDAPDGNELEVVNIAIGGQVTAFASGYNNTGSTYVGLVEVDWTDIPDLGTFDNNTGTNTVFTAGLTGGSTNITGQNTTLVVSDNFTVIIAGPTIDYILITDAPDGNELEIVNIDISGQVTAYASGYNTTSGYVDLVEVDWTDNPDLGTFDNDTGTNTVFTAGVTSGTTNIIGQNTTLVVSDNFFVVIADPTIDYIIITDAPNGNELEIVNIDVGGQVTAYASGYNNTGSTYVGLLEVDWTDVPDLGTFDNDTGTNTVFTAGLVPGSTTITGQNVTLAVSDTFNVDITNAIVDYIQIRDAAGGGGSVVTSLTLDVGQSTTLWAAAYNYTSGYISDYASTNWSESNGGSVITVTTPGASTSVQAQLIGGQSTITADYSGIQNTTSVTVNPPTVDYIQIRDGPGGGEAEPGWWNENWSYRKKLTFDNTEQSEALVNFSVLVVLNSSNFDYSKAKLDGSDLRFIDTDNVTELTYHIEDWNTSGNSYIWVNVPHIAANSDTDYIWMYYDNPDATDVQDESGIYDENYVMVQHLNETSGTHYDSTGYDNDGSPGGGVTQNATGQIDGADDFDGNDDYVEVSDSASLDITDEITIEAWVYFKGPGARAPYNSVVSKRKANDGYSLQIYNDRRVLFFINGVNNAEKYIVSILSLMPM